MANHHSSGAQAMNAKVNVGNYVQYTVYAASTSTVTVYDEDGTSLGTYTVPSSGILTITDLANQVAVNAAFRVVGLVSTTVA